jgi:hypothetical protein
MHPNYQFQFARRALAAKPRAAILSNRPGKPARVRDGERSDDLS